MIAPCLSPVFVLAGSTLEIPCDMAGSRLPRGMKRVRVLENVITLQSDTIDKLLDGLLRRVFRGEL